MFSLLPVQDFTLFLLCLELFSINVVCLFGFLLKSEPREE